MLGVSIGVYYYLPGKCSLVSLTFQPPIVTYALQKPNTHQVPDPARVGSFY